MNGGCASWYLDKHGNNTTLWPGFTFEFRKITKQFRPRAPTTPRRRVPDPRRAVSRSRPRHDRPHDKVASRERVRGQGRRRHRRRVGHRPRPRARTSPRRGAKLALSDVDSGRPRPRPCGRSRRSAREVKSRPSRRHRARGRARLRRHRRGALRQGQPDLQQRRHRLPRRRRGSEFKDIERVIDVDFWGVVNGTKAFLPHLIASGDGHIVNVSSLFGLLSIPGQSAYNAAKFAVRGFTESLRQEMLIAKHPVQVTVRASRRHQDRHRPQRDGRPTDTTRSPSPSSSTRSWPGPRPRTPRDHPRRASRRTRRAC